MLTDAGCKRSSQVVNFWEEERRLKELGREMLSLRAD